MTDTYSYNDTVKIARNIKTNVEKSYKLGENTQWAYFIAKQITNPKVNVNKWYIKPAPKSSGDNISRQILKKDYMDMANRLIKYVDNNKTLPNYITVNGLRMNVNDYTYMFARILAYYDTNKVWPNYANVNSKAFTKPTETKNDVYNYKTSIDRMKQGKGVNCTDSCHVFYNIMLQLIELGKYKKVECLHIKCRSGDGHVRLRITLKDGSYIYRDPAAVLDSGVITKNWCSNGTLLAVNPSWFMNNLKR